MIHYSENIKKILMNDMYTYNLLIIEIMTLDSFKSHFKTTPSSLYLIFLNHLFHVYHVHHVHRHVYLSMIFYHHDHFFQL